jgi:hypothetical protein
MKRKNFISKLVTDDQTVTNQEDKHHLMFDFFEQLLGTAGSRNCSLNLGFFHRHGAELSALDQPISEEEVWDSVKSMPADRAPGPDGYIGQFYKSCWNIIKADFMAAIMNLFQGDDMKLWLLNSAYLTLIPKKDDAISAKDFCPISLIYSFVKLITKILANWLAPLLDSLVATNQSAFIRGRCIHDNFILVQQSIKLFHKLKVPSLFLKLNISKAFDSISWPFLFEVLSHVGFGSRWCKLVGNILSSASTRIILNGQPGDQIRHRRGLRQGDPLSPMLFVLVMDVLNSLFCKARELGLL